MKADWKIASDYDYTEALTPEGWAWEFARRNLEYKKAFKEYQETVKVLQDELGDEWKSSEKAKRPDPPKEPGENEQEWRMRAEDEGKRARSIPLDKAMGLPFHLKGMYDPDEMFDQGVEFLPVTNFPIILTEPDRISAYIKDVLIREGGEDEYYDSMLDPDYAILILDLSISTETQIPKLKSLIEKARQVRKLKKPQASFVHLIPWTRFLRILDAKHDAISDEEIASILWPDSEPTDSEPTDTELNDDPITSLLNAYKSAKKWSQTRRYIRCLQMKI